ncbi:CMGC/CDK protein kinase [Pyricularia oryzae]|nr:CMGC/CDK protein kinase [Pyricularia oryzae]KAI7920725.1 CMGC/CDK protein kinase [Pyricularia oryzae]
MYSCFALPEQRKEPWVLGIGVPAKIFKRDPWTGLDWTQISIETRGRGIVRGLVIHPLSPHSLTWVAKSRGKKKGPGATPMPDLGKILRKERVASKWTEQPGSWFVPSKRLQKLVTRNAVRAELLKPGTETTTTTLKEILDAVCGTPRKPQSASARRLFAILTLINQAKVIGAVIDEGVTDGHLPLVHTSGNHRAGKLSLCRRVPLQKEPDACTSLAGLAPHVQEGFVNSQKTIDVPTFRLGPAGTLPIVIQHLELDWSTTLPFVHHKSMVGKDVQCFADSWRSGNGAADHSGASSGTRTGGFSEVCKIKIHSQQYNREDFPTSKGGKGFFALKILKQNTTREMFDRERTTLERLMAYPQANIVRLLGTMERHNSNEDLPTYYLIFPWADSNLEDFMVAKHPVDGKPSRGAALTLWVARQALGLARALELLHHCSAVGRDGRQASKPFGRHGDIKPSNILWYCGAQRGDRDDDAGMGTLKLADFGAAEFHSEHTMETPANQAINTPSHRAPEYETGKPISPSVDVWSLGAVLLELVVWYMGGKAAWVGFRGARLDETDAMCAVHDKMVKNDSYYKLLRQNENGHVVGADVKESVHSVHEMLVVAADKRISSEDLVRKLETLVENCETAGRPLDSGRKRKRKRTSDDMNGVEPRRSKRIMLMKAAA